MRCKSRLLLALCVPVITRNLWVELTETLDVSMLMETSGLGQT